MRLKRNNSFLFLSILTFLYFTPLIIHSQDHNAPSLQVGLGGIGLSRGTLDQELIIEIISEKQDELKEKAIKYALLNQLTESGSTIYGYVDNTIETVRTEKDPQIRTRNLIENSINFVYATSFSRYIFEKYKTDIDLIAIFDLIKKVQILPYPNVSNNAGIFAKYTTPVNEVKFVDGSETISYNTSNPNGNSKNANKMYDNYKHLEYINNKSNISSFGSLEQIDMEGYDLSKGEIAYYENSTQFVTYLFDLSSVVLSEDPLLSKLGVLKSNYLADYKMFNKYLNAKEYFTDPIFEMSEADASSLVTHGDALKTKIQADLKKITRYAGLFAYVEDLNKLEVDNLTDFFKRVKKVTLTKANLNKYSDDLSIALAASLNQLDLNKEFISNMSSNHSETVSYQTSNIEFYKERLSILQGFASKIENMDLDNITNSTADGNDAFLILSDLLFELNLKVIPAINEIVAYDPNLITIKSTLNQLTHHILNILSSNVSAHNELFASKFAIMISKLYKFDEASSISELLTSLNDVGKLIKNDDAQNVINLINSFTNRYMKVSKNDSGNDVIDFDIEGYLLALKKRPLKGKPFELHFTVGTNTGQFYSLNGGIKNKEYVLGNDTLTSLASVSEKIGFKLKFKDWKYERSFNKGEVFRNIYGKEYKRLSPPSEPIVSNVHLLLFGSGLLYNIINTTTQNEFSAPLLGGGLGVSFFNGLDFNVTAATPVSENFKTINNKRAWLFSIGFDIQFTEYLSRYNKKRRESRQAAAITEAIDSSN